MGRSHNVKFVTAGLILVGFGLGEMKAIAQTTYQFEALYNTNVTIKPITPEVSQVTVIGENANAPFGLTNLRSENYGQLDPNTNVYTFSADPARFGLENLPLGSDTLFGSNDSLIGNSNASALIDFENLTVTGSGTINITGGTGRFTGAQGTLTFTENDTLNPDPTAPLIGQALVKGSFQTSEKVPEARNDAALVGIGLLGTGFLLRRINKKTQKYATHAHLK